MWNTNNLPSKSTNYLYNLIWIVWVLISISIISISSSDFHPNHDHQRCKPPNSPKLPERKYKLEHLYIEFDHIVEKSKITNQRRFDRLRAKTNISSIIDIRLGIQLGSLGPDNFAQVLPVIDLALDDIQNSSDFEHVRFTSVPILYIDALACDALAVLNYLNSDGVNVLFGPLNDFALANVARFSSAKYMVPIVSPAGFAHQLNDKLEFEMLTRVLFTYSDLEWVFINTFKQYGWLPNKQTPVALFNTRKTRRPDGAAGHTGMTGTFQRLILQQFLVKEAYKLLSVTLDDETNVKDRFLSRLPDSARSKFINSIVISV